PAAIIIGAIEAAAVTAVAAVTIAISTVVRPEAVEHGRVVRQALVFLNDGVHGRSRRREDLAFRPALKLGLRSRNGGRWKRHFGLSAGVLVVENLLQLFVILAQSDYGVVFRRPGGQHCLDLL